MEGARPNRAGPCGTTTWAINNIHDALQPKARGGLRGHPAQQRPRRDEQPSTGRLVPCRSLSPRRCDGAHPSVLELQATRSRFFFFLTTQLRGVVGVCRGVCVARTTAVPPLHIIHPPASRQRRGSRRCRWMTCIARSSVATSGFFSNS